MQVGDAFGQLLRETRRRRGLSLRELSSRCAALNRGDALGLDHTRLHKLETKGRKHAVTLEQWLLLSAALDCPPLTLLVPLGTGDVLEVTATSRIHPYLALKWLRGDDSLATTERGSVDHPSWLRMRRKVELYDRLAAAEVGETPTAPLPNGEGRAAYHEMATILQSMIEEDVLPPRLHPWQLARLGQYGANPDRMGLRGYTPHDWTDQPRTIMRHPALRDTFEIPTSQAEHYAAIGWQEIDR